VNVAPAAPDPAPRCGIAATSPYVWSSVMITTTLGLSPVRGVARPRGARPGATKRDRDRAKHCEGAR
jgi:hypothetical protein